MSGFVQIIEFKTTRIDELQDLADEMGTDSGPGGALRGTVTQDRDRPGWYFNIVEFDSYESAMANSTRPEVSAFAARMAALCEEPPRFYNLDVMQTWSAGPSTTTKAAVATAATAVAGAAATGLTKARQRLQERRTQRTRTASGGTVTPPPRFAADAVSETASEVEYRTPPPSSTSSP
jgi:hypothetical protein